MTPAEILKDKVSDLQSQLLSQNPNLPMLLRDIHKQLAEDPQIVTILTEDDIGIIVSGLKKQTQTEIATGVAKGKGKSVKNLTLDDI